MIMKGQKLWMKTLTLVCGEKSEDEREWTGGSGKRTL